MMRVLRTLPLDCVIIVPVLHLHLFLFGFLSSFVLCYVPPPVTSLMLHRTFVSHHAVRGLRYRPLSALPPVLPKMIVEAEDAHFYKHTGIDVKAIFNAIRLNRNADRNAFGASTITQQLTRTLFLSPRRTYERKYFEALLSLCVDAFISKDRILELYVTVAEWGEGVFGIEQAARFYYDRGAETLMRDECARLVTILASPIRYTPRSFEQRPFLRKRYERIRRVYIAPSR